MRSSLSPEHLERDREKRQAPQVGHFVVSRASQGRDVLPRRVMWPLEDVCASSPPHYVILPPPLVPVSMFSSGLVFAKSVVRTRCAAHSHIRSE